MRGVIIPVGFGAIQYGQHKFSDIQDYSLGQAMVFFKWILEEEEMTKKPIAREADGSPKIYTGAKHQSKKKQQKADQKKDEIRCQKSE